LLNRQITRSLIDGVFVSFLTPHFSFISFFLFSTSHMLRLIVHFLLAVGFPCACVSSADRQSEISTKKYSSSHCLSLLLFASGKRRRKMSFETPMATPSSSAYAARSSRSDRNAAPAAIKTFKGIPLVPLAPGASCILHVANIPSSIARDVLYTAFSQLGPLRQLRVGDSAETKGSAFVVFESVVDAQRAVTTMNGQVLTDVQADAGRRGGTPPAARALLVRFYDPKRHQTALERRRRKREEEARVRDDERKARTDAAAASTAAAAAAEAAPTGGFSTGSGSAHGDDAAAAGGAYPVQTMEGFGADDGYDVQVAGDGAYQQL
jgi:hypothetical protein